ncbi:hypothetical protein GCM10009733_000220 [Nonomuraea maheshkhaliensis]|uniref:Uncharacterized protein n=1 Tax=Nonomuraea maheshkhaliensis TaxID=419590 RepID=A0ABN2EI82_9ACTN
MPWATVHAPSPAPHHSVHPPPVPRHAFHPPPRPGAPPPVPWPAPPPPAASPQFGATGCLLAIVVVGVVFLLYVMVILVAAASKSPSMPYGSQRASCVPWASIDRSCQSSQVLSRAA